jgi:hypothetical protein
VYGASEVQTTRRQGRASTGEVEACLANILQTDGARQDNTEAHWTDEIERKALAQPDRATPDNTGQHRLDSGLPSSNPRVGGSSPSGRAVLFPQVRSLSRLTSNLLTSAWPLWAGTTPASTARRPTHPAKAGRNYSSSRNPSAEKPAWRRIERRVPGASSRCMGTITVRPST